MIHHVSIPARDPEHVAKVLSELLGGHVGPFVGPIPGAWVAYADDGNGSGFEVYPERTTFVPGQGDDMGEIELRDAPASFAFHAFVSVKVDRATIERIGERDESWRTKHLFGEGRTRTYACSSSTSSGSKIASCLNSPPRTCCPTTSGSYQRFRTAGDPCPQVRRRKQQLFIGGVGADAGRKTGLASRTYRSVRALGTGFGMYVSVIVRTSSVDRSTAASIPAAVKETRTTDQQHPTNEFAYRRICDAVALGLILKGARTLRVGDYRVIYRIELPDVVLILKIGHRREVYSG